MGYDNGIINQNKLFPTDIVIEPNDTKGTTNQSYGSKPAFSPNSRLAVNLGSLIAVHLKIFGHINIKKST
jgi:hypothetical protein